MPRTIVFITLILLFVLISASCRSMLSRKYEYDEDVYLQLDGSAIVYLNASVPALVALRGLDLPLDPRARVDRNKVRAVFQTPATRVASVTLSRRDNRRYVHLRLEVPDIRRLGEAAPFAWSRYQLERRDGLIVYRQTVDASAGRDVENVGWTGTELVAFRLHLPSRVPFFNAPSREIERGNIIVWEQPLAERVRGVPVNIEAHFESQSILAHTLTLFGLMVLLAGLTFAVAIWWVVRKGRNLEIHARS